MCRRILLSDQRQRRLNRQRTLLDQYLAALVTKYANTASEARREDVDLKMEQEVVRSMKETRDACRKYASLEIRKNGLHAKCGDIAGRLSKVLGVIEIVGDTG